jgi:antitoxin component of MazEF toxin-antitoxin module
MTIVIKSSDEKHISIPASLMAQLNLREGEEVKATVNGNTLRLERIDKFLRLRGALANNPAFDKAMEYLERAWKAWTPPDSV